MAERGDYEAIMATFGETARGRWFLDEVARQARAQDTRVLLDALRRLERAVLPATEGDGFAAPQAPAPAVADGFARVVLDAAEDIQETAWAMRETGADPRLCDTLDRSAAALYAACTRQADAFSGSALSGQNEAVEPAGAGERFRLLP